MCKNYMQCFEGKKHTQKTYFMICGRCDGACQQVVYFDSKTTFSRLFKKCQKKEKQQRMTSFQTP